MFELPNIFHDNNEDYMTMPIIKEFIKFNMTGEKISRPREDLVKTIELYANSSEGARGEVVEWIDNIAKEGIKQLFIRYIEENKQFHRLYDDEYMCKILEKELERHKINNTNLCLNEYGEELKMVKYSIDNGIRGRVISLWLGKYIYVHNRYNNITTKSIYPVFVDVYVDKGIITVRGKSKSNMYLYDNDDFDIYAGKSTNVEKECKGALSYIKKLLGIDILGTGESNKRFRKKLFLLLDRYTHTPPEIKAELDKNKELLKNIQYSFVNEIKNFQPALRSDLKYDIMNMFEKYLSICWQDRGVFTAGRAAYPLKLKATDEELSKVEQTSGLEQPLQSKAIFFDNKKMLQRSKTCDGMVFMFRKMNPENLENEYKVTILAKKEYCSLKFEQYTREEDIDNVLFSIIDSQGSDE